MTAASRSSAYRAAWVAAYGLTLGLVALGLVAHLESRGSWEPHLPLPWLGVATAFFAVEAGALHIEIRRQTHSLSLSGLPLLLGALSVGPVPLVVARLVGGGIALVLIRRRTGLKLAWNLCLFAAETAVAMAIAAPALTGGAPQGLVDWTILLAALLAAEATSLVAVPIVIMLAEGELRLSLFAQIGRSQLVAVVGAAFSVITAAAMLATPGLLLLALVPVAGVVVLLHIHGELGKQHHDLRQIHSFTMAIGARHPLDAALEELTSILRCRGAALVTDAGDGTILIRTHLDNDLVSLEMTSSPGLAETDGHPGPEPASTSGAGVPASVVTVGGDAPSHPLDRVLEQLGASRGLAVGLDAAAGGRTHLVTFDRLGASPTFGPEEVNLFESMAAALGARLAADNLLEELQRQATVDALTGLANRVTLEQALDRRLVDRDGGGAVLVLDLDGFKHVNDSLGHQVGDELLKTLARRIEAMTRPGDVAARLGGDEFAVLIGTLPASGTIDTRLEQLATQLTQPVSLDGITLELNVSIGAALWPDDGVTGRDLLRHADMAMYEAKRTHQRWARYDPAVDHASADRLALMGQLRDAIEQRQLEIHLQAQVRSDTGDLVGAEALLRWNHPELGMIPPARFIPLAEHSSLASEVTQFVLEEATRVANRLHGEGLALTISCNLTGRDLLDRDLPHFLAGLLERTGVPASSLTLEVTEGSLIADFDTAITNLITVRGLGCRTSVDDFGTGYASLQYLQRLPVDEVKIDRAFVSGVATNPNDRAIVTSTTRLLQDLGLEVVAEGVEDATTMGVISDIGCDIVQGYHISRPVPEAEFMALALGRPGRSGQDGGEPVEVG